MLYRQTPSKRKLVSLPEDEQETTINKAISYRESAAVAILFLMKKYEFNLDWMMDKLKGALYINIKLTKN